MKNAALTSSPSVPEIDTTAVLEPLRTVRSRWPAYLSGGVTLILLVALARELFRGGLDGLEAALPTNPLFYIVFVAIYAVQPVADYIIFRKLWGLPPSGIIPILRKMVANEVLLGYSGEAYFYAWARTKKQMVAAPFAAIKDVSILSAVVGNVFTLIMLGIAMPFAYQLLPANLVNPIVSSAAVIMLLSLAIIFFRGRLLSLSGPELRWVFTAHMVRTLVYTGLLSLCWHLALPEVPLSIWIILVTSRQLVARLPLIPNKDIVFANLALVMVGAGGTVAQLIGITVALTLLCHGLMLLLTSLPQLRRTSD